MPTLASNSPFSASGLWDTLVIAGSIWKGKVDVRGAKRAYKVQTKDAPGIEGATQTYRGRRPETFEITFYVWTDSLYAQWQQFSQLFFATQSGNKSTYVPLTIGYPSLALLGITQILVREVGGLEPQGETGMYAAKVKVEEFLPPILNNATTTPKAAAIPPLLVPVSPTAAQAAAQQQKNSQQMALTLGLKGGLPF